MGLVIDRGHQTFGGTDWSETTDTGRMYEGIDTKSLHHPSIISPGGGGGGGGQTGGRPGTQDVWRDRLVIDQGHRMYEA